MLGGMHERPSASIEPRVFAAADLDRDIRVRLIVLAVIMVPFAVLSVILVVAVFKQEGAVAAATVSLPCLVGALVPFGIVGRLPTGFVVEGVVLHVHTRWLWTNSFRHLGRAEVFQDADALRRRRFFSSGRPRFNAVVTRTMGLPKGKVYFALTDRRRAVLVRSRGRTVFVSPADPEAFCRAVQDANG